MIDQNLSGEPQSFLAFLDTWLPRIAAGRTVRKIGQAALSMGATTDEVLALQGLAMTEMSARPLDARIIEWMCVLGPRYGLLGRIGRAWAMRRTVGPLQLRNGPFAVKAAVQLALERLRMRGVDPTNVEQLALMWHGPATERTACVPYRLVLQQALRVLAVSLEEPAVEFDEQPG